MTAAALRPFLRAIRRALAVAGLTAALATLAGPAQAVTIEPIRSAGGITAWLVQERAVPLVTMHFAFRGGTSQDPADKAGTANLVASLLDEGAGPYDSRAFSALVDRHAVEYRFNAGYDYFRGSLRVLKEHRDRGFELLRLMLLSPRFDADAVERVRLQVISALQREQQQPASVAAEAWWTAAFPGHAYGRRMKGTIESVQRVSADDLRDYRRRIFARDGLTVAIVGDIDAETARQVLDRTFGELPQHGERVALADAAPQALGREIAQSMAVPQTAIVFGGRGLPRAHPDFIPAYVANHILGGGSFSSRLYREVREKRGLAYSIYTSMLWLRHAALVIGTTATRADRAGEVMGLIAEEVRRMREEGPTAEELAEAKSYLKGSYALSLDTSTKIAAQLVQIQLDGLGIDYIDRRGQLIDAVTLADAKRALARLFDGGLLFATAGRPPTAAPKSPGG